MRRGIIAIATVLALALFSGPQVAAQPGFLLVSSVASSSAPVPWPGGRISERWHSEDELSLFVRLGRTQAELRYRGTDGRGGPLETWIIIDGHWNPVDYSNVRQALRLAGESAGRGMQALRDFRAALSEQNLNTFDWVEERTGGERPVLTSADQDRISKVIARAEALGLEKHSCVEDSMIAAGVSSGWLLCILLAAGTAGGSLVPCFILGAGAYFMTFHALVGCNGGVSSFDGCQCDDPVPDCMCCPGIDPGDYCTCYCPGEDCCNWPD